LIVSRIIIDAFEELKMEYPKTTPKREDELKAIRQIVGRRITESTWEGLGRWPQTKHNIRRGFS